MKKGTILFSNFLILSFFILIMVTFHFGFYLILINSDLLSLKQIIILNNRFVSADEIPGLTGLKKGMNILGLDLNRISKVIKFHNLIEDVEVKRLLPDRLEIRIKEKDIVANLYYREMFFLLDKNGEIITNGYFPSVPVLEVDYPLTSEKNKISDEFLKFTLNNLFSYGKLDKFKKILIKKESGVYIYLKNLEDTCFFIGKKIPDEVILDRIFFLSESIINNRMKVNYVDLRKENAIGQ